MTSSASKGLYILGFGGHARSVADVAMLAGWNDFVFVDNNAQPNEQFHSFKVLSALPAVVDLDWKVFPAAGDNHRRREQVAAAQMELATVISPQATIGVGAVISDATLVCHGVHIGPDARIGCGIILNTHSVIEHEVEIGNFTHISVNATIAGRTRVGSDVMVGAGAVLIDSVTVCDDVIIGAGAVVTSDITEPGTYVGIPARRIVKKPL